MDKTVAPGANRCVGCPVYIRSAFTVLRISMVRKRFLEIA